MPNKLAMSNNNSSTYIKSILNVVKITMHTLGLQLEKKKQKTKKTNNPLT
jgi:hypothetical protein